MVFRYPDMFRHFESREMFANVRLDVAHGKQFCRRHHHRRGYGLAQTFVWQAEDRALRHSWVIEYHRLDFGASDIFAASDDHVFFTIGDIDKILFIHVTDITGTQLPVHKRVGRRVRIVPITREDHRAFDLNLAGGTSRDFGAVGTDDTHLDKRWHWLAATGRSLPEVIACVGCGETVGFGHAVCSTRSCLALTTFIDTLRMFWRHCGAAAANAA